MSLPPEDPLLRRARHEALVVALMWIAAMSYTVGYCRWFGYREGSTEPLKLVYGFPDWVFWGIVVPWVTCVVVGIWFSYSYMRNDDVSDGLAPQDETEEQLRV